MSETSPFALVVLYPGCIEFEVMLAAHLLGSKFRVKVATPDGESFFSENGMRIEADFSFREACDSDPRVLLVAGGGPGSVAGNQDLNALVQNAKANGALLAAICAGPFVLGQAGVLRGRKVAHGYEAAQLVFLREAFAGAEMTDAHLQVEEGLITAKAQAFVEFALAVAKESGAIQDPIRLERLLRFYKGPPLP